MRFVIIGTSGAGKTTFAHDLALAVQSPHIELDSLHWGADWTPVPAEAFASAVQAATEGDHWVADGNYSSVRDLLWSRATHIVWLNYSRSTVFSRVIIRTLGRVISRRPLWHGNRESLRNAFFSKDSILWWSFTGFSKNRARYPRLRREPRYAHLQWFELTRPSQARAFIDSHQRKP